MSELQTITEIIDALRVVPGIGHKSAERIAYELLKTNSINVTRLITALEHIQENISLCPICGAYQENGHCSFCGDENRDKTKLVIVSYYKDALAFERIHSFHGLYHILNGVISPTKGISTKDINLASLLKRVEEGTIEEIIIATNPTLDGEATALYIAKLLEDYKNIKLTRLAYGLPMGANLDYADDLTLLRAFEGRTNIR